MKNQKNKQPEIRYGMKAWELVMFAGTLLLVSVLSFGFHIYLAEKRLAQKTVTEATVSQDCQSSISMIRDNDNHLTRPLYLVDVNTESSKYSPLKNNLAEAILASEKNGKVTSVSVYYRNLKDASWMSINGQEDYSVDKMLKVPVMICFLKQEEEHPGTLNQALSFNNGVVKISGLIRSMIVESDDKAGEILRKNLKPGSLQSLFSELQIPFSGTGDECVITPKNYSKFLRILFSTTYLSKELSEYALDLLSKSGNGGSLSKSLSSGITIAGRRTVDQDKNNTELSESSIVYEKSRPYLLTVMTRGSDPKTQSELIDKIATQVYKSREEN